MSVAAISSVKAQICLYLLHKVDHPSKHMDLAFHVQRCRKLQPRSVLEFAIALE